MGKAGWWITARQGTMINALEMELFEISGGS
jgi:hypothetical protein